MTSTQARKTLLAMLAAADPLDDPTAFVLLWTYFQTVGLTDVENRFVVAGRMPGPNLGHYPTNSDDPVYTASAGRKWLTGKAREADFDMFALSWLAGIDRVLACHRGTFEHEIIIGLDRGSYKVRPLNNWIASFFDGIRISDHAAEDDTKRAVTTRRKLSLALSLYCRHFIVVDVGIREGLRVQIKSEHRWGNPLVHDRLRAVRDTGLRFLCWPSRYPLNTSRRPAVNGEFVRVYTAPPASARHRELARAVRSAKRNKAAILVLPELSVAADDLACLQQLLDADETAEYPVLTVAGLVHEESGEGDLNVAVILGPDGAVLHRHRKLTRYGGGDSDDIDWMEGIATGDMVGVLESPVGNLTLLICRDLFHETVAPRVVASHSNILLVPSLSPKTTAHATAAFRFLSSNAAATIVCNRWVDIPDGGRAGTFVLLPGKTPDGKKTLYVQLEGDEDALLCPVE